MSGLYEPPYPVLVEPQDYDDVLDLYDHGKSPGQIAWILWLPSRVVRQIIEMRENTGKAGWLAYIETCCHIAEDPTSKEGEP